MKQFLIGSMVSMSSRMKCYRFTSRREHYQLTRSHVELPIDVASLSRSITCQLHMSRAMR